MECDLCEGVLRIGVHTVMKSSDGATDEMSVSSVN